MINLIILLLSLSFRSANIDNVPFDYEMIGGLKGKNNKVSLMFERENGRRYYGRDVFFSKDYVEFAEYVKTAKDINNQRLSFLFPKYEWLSLGYTISGRDWTTFRNLLTVKIKRKYILLMYSRNDNHRDIEGKISYEKRISKHVILKPLIVYRQYDKKMFWQSKIQLEINFN